MVAEPFAVTHLIRAKPPGELGGADGHLLDLATAQAAEGHRVRVIFLGPTSLTAAVGERGIPVVQVHSMSMVNWVRAVHAELRDNPPDVLHSHGYRADLVAVALRRFRPPSARWILVLTVHGFLRTSLGLRALSRINEHVMRYADVVIAVSSSEARRLSWKLRRTVRFIPNEVAPADLVPRPEARQRLGIDPARSVVAFVGRLSREKRPDLFVAMAARVALDRPEAVFVVIGSGDLLDETVRQAAATPNVPIMFAGLVSNVVSLMTCFDVLVCPSDTEGTPRVVIEAMFAGVPVVATRVGGLPDLIIDGRTGLLVAPNSVTALAGQVTRLLGDPSLAGEISHAARARLQRTALHETMASRGTAAYRSELVGATVPERIGMEAAPTDGSGLRA